MVPAGEKNNMEIRKRVMRTVKRIAVGLLICGLMTPVMAESGFTKRWYGGIAAGISELEPDPNGTPVTVDESRSAGGKLFLGYDLSERFSIEGQYADLGEADMAPTDAVGYQEISLSGLYYLYKQHREHTGFGLFGKVGAAKMENDTGLRYERVNDFSLAYGIGLEYAFRNGFALRSELELFDKDARFLSVSLMKRFGATGEEMAPPPAEPAPEPEPIPVAPPLPPVPEPQPEPAPAAPLGQLEIIYFLSDSAELTSEARAKLDRVVAELQRVPDARVEVQGHTDNRNTEAYNMALSKRRIRSVIDYLAGKGIALDRLRPLALGETSPAASNATAEGRSLNRRVEFRELER